MKISKRAHRWIQDNKGQSYSEYVIVLSLIAIASISVYTVFGKQVRTLTGMIGMELSGDASNQIVSNSNNGVRIGPFGRVQNGDGTGAGTESNLPRYDGNVNENNPVPTVNTSTAPIGIGTVWIARGSTLGNVANVAGWIISFIEPTPGGEAAMAGITAWRIDRLARISAQAANTAIAMAEISQDARDTLEDTGDQGSSGSGADPDGDDDDNGDNGDDGDDGDDDVLPEDAEGLIGDEFEEFLRRKLGGRGSFIEEGREFDGAVGNRWYEAKSGRYWERFCQKGKGFEKFKSDMGRRLTIARKNEASYEVHSNTPIPEHVKKWLVKKDIPFFEH